MSDEGWEYVELGLLSRAERQALAYDAKSHVWRQEDFRYWHKDPIERERLRKRWQSIADAFYPPEEEAADKIDRGSRMGAVGPEQAGATRTETEKPAGQGASRASDQHL